MTTLTIAHRWDGVRLAHAAARLRLALEPDALRIEVEAPFHGDPAPTGAAGPTDRLWEHEVVELFIQGSGPAYTEVELGPAGHHLVLRLDGVRQVRDSLLPIDFAAEVLGGRWRGVARVPRSLLPALPWRGNAYAIHGPPRARVYSAWQPVPGAQPDFHQPAAFAPLGLGGADG